MHYLLLYDVVPDYVERRAAFRDEHLSLAWEAHARGELVLGGALDDPVDGAVLLSSDSPAAAEAFAARDPYVGNGSAAHAGGLRLQRARHAMASPSPGRRSSATRLTPSRPTRSLSGLTPSCYRRGMLRRNGPAIHARRSSSRPPRAFCRAASTARSAPSSRSAPRRCSSCARRGAQIEDVDGNRYIDYVMSWGPLIHGHAPQRTGEGARGSGRATAPASARRPARESSSASASRC